MPAPRMRIKRSVETTPNGTKVVRQRLQAAPDLEWRLQAEAVRQLRALPSYNKQFTIAGDQNAGKRGPQAQVIAKATGLEPGEPDIRVYLRGGRLKLIEAKALRGKLSPAQIARHEVLTRLGFEVVTVQAATKEEFSAAVLNLVKAWLEDPVNDNGRRAAA